jgi:hypothetical protein
MSKSDLLVPFHIPAGGSAANHAFVRIRPQQGFTSGKIRLVVVSGGPVFGFESDLSSGTEAAGRVNALNSGDSGPDFDIAAVPSGPAEILKESLPSIMTLSSAVESIGFVQFCESY